MNRLDGYDPIFERILRSIDVREAALPHYSLQAIALVQQLFSLLNLR